MCRELVIGGKTRGTAQCRIIRDFENETLSCLFLLSSLCTWKSSSFFSLSPSLSSPSSIICQVNAVVGVELALLKRPKIRPAVAFYSCIHLHPVFVLKRNNRNRSSTFFFLVDILNNYSIIYIYISDRHNSQSRSLYVLTIYQWGKKRIKLFILWQLSLVSVLSVIKTI
jgi:hypothetical protein